MYTKLWLEDLKGRELGRPRHRWQNYIGMNHKKIGWENVDSMHLARDMDQ
jgi:hypothetical protein